MIPRSPELAGDVINRITLADAAARLVRYRPGCHMPLHAHDWTSVTLVLAGTLIDIIDRRRLISGPLTLIIKPAGLPHDTRIGSDRALTLNFQIAPAAAPALADCRIVASGLATSHLLGLPSPCAPAPPRTLGQVLSAAPSASPALGPAPRGEFATTRDAALAARMHPVAYARRFRRDTGWSPGRWRLHHRLARAAAALADSAEPIASIAGNSGFADQSHLSRLFKRETGLSPGQFRGLVAALARG